jgi:photosystem II stability/assembly factor-like uncharacterized protein
MSAMGLSRGAGGPAWFGLGRLRHALLAVALVVAATARVAAGQGYVWRNVRIVAGGFVPGIVFSPARAGLAYLRTDIGGFYRSDDAGRHWVPITDWVDADHGNWLGGESIAPDPVDPSVVYAAAGMYPSNPAAMLRSHDAGRTWQATPVPIHMGGNSDGRGCGERLAVDPNHRDRIYFGSRSDGLWASDDAAVHWHRVAGFPARPGGGGRRTGYGIGFVLVDPRSGSGGGISRTVYAGVSQPGAESALYRSDDGGDTWRAVPGLPAGLVAHQGAIEPTTGSLYLTLGNGAGPNGVTDGAVYRLDMAAGTWTDVSPIPRTAGQGFGYAGISLDRGHAGTLVVTTADRWNRGDDVFRSVDRGRSWRAVGPTQHLDVSLSPYLRWGQPRPREGWWMDAVAIDPFDGNRCLYGTGATVYGTDDLTDVQAGRPTRWAVSADGIEETAAICLVSPPAGPPLISGLGDVCGFVHDDLTVAPPGGMMDHPINNNTTGIDFAQRRPNVVLRAGEKGASLSEDGGHTWTQVGEREGGGSGTVAVTADGVGLLWSRRSGVVLSTDAGKTWAPVDGLPVGAAVVSDRVDAARAYALAGGTLYTSGDGGRSFVAAARQLPGRGRLVAGPAAAGDLYIAGGGPPLHSTDGGRTFAPVPNVTSAKLLAVGPGPGPMLFVAGVVAGRQSVFRSDDGGRHWTDVLDAAHRFGWLPDAMTADPRVPGRVYLGTNGRGVLYGEPR